MKCMRCSAEIPSQSQFCLRCGSPISATALPPTTLMGQTLAPPAASHRGLVPLLWVLAIAVLGLGGYAGSKILSSADKSEGSNLVQSPHSGGGIGMVQAPAAGSGTGLVQAPADAAPNNMVQTPGEAPIPTGAIEDYLEKLKRIETTKQRLMRKQVGDALMLLAQAKGLSASIDEGEYNNTFANIGKGMDYSAEDWNALTQELNQLTPPEACRDLHNRYYDHLGKIQGYIVSVNDAFSQVQENPSNALQTLTQLQGHASADVDASVMASDDALYRVCQKYRLQKTFDIKGDGGSSSLIR